MIAEMSDPLIGLTVQIVIDEDGTPSPPLLPHGTVVDSRIDAKGNLYHVVRLDQDVKCLSAISGREWTLSKLVVWPAFKGDSLQRLLGLSTGDLLLVGIANITEPLDKGQLLDRSRVAYFARGRMERVQRS